MTSVTQPRAEGYGRPSGAHPDGRHPSVNAPAVTSPREERLWKITLVPIEINTPEIHLEKQYERDIGEGRYVVHESGNVPDDVRNGLFGYVFRNGGEQGIIVSFSDKSKIKFWNNLG